MTDEQRTRIKGACDFARELDKQGRQCFGAMKHGPCFCFIGVLIEYCRLHAGLMPPEKGRIGLIPMQVAEWYGITRTIPYAGNEGRETSLVALNDDWRLSLAQIADAVEDTYGLRGVSA